MPTVLITGANRGIGLEFVRQYLDDGWDVHACCRQPDQASDLQAFSSKGSLKIHALDVTEANQIAALGQALSQTELDVLINNAGIYGPSVNFGNIDYDGWAKVFSVNTMAPMRLAETFISHLSGKNSGKLINITSKMGSIDDNTSGGSYIYRSSKAALNAVTKSLAVDLSDRGILCAAIHPGWVQTDMGGPNALIDTQTSVSNIRRVIYGMTPTQSGGFFNYDGAPIPW